ncbi:hypothetical protein ABGT15_02345 [Flavobacterium enshiense]|uniref:OB-fold protein n=1 Tax=Flavobacterium enshiense TaxID=1341165 RepID=UPI00345CC210
MKKVGYLLILGLVIIMGWAFYSYLYKEHRNIAEEKGSFSVSADSIYNEYITNETKANAKYLDKTIVVQGKISKINITENTIVIDEKMVVYFQEKVANTLKEFNTIKVKGRFLGYDELLGEMKMDQTVVVNN